MYGQQADFFNHYRNLQEQVRSEILRESEEQILGTSTDDLAQYIYGAHSIAPIVEDKELEASFDIQDYLKRITANNRENFYRSEGDIRDFPCQRAVVELPIKSNEDLAIIAKLRASTYSTGYSDEEFKWGVDSISRIIETKGYGFEHDQTQIANDVEQALISIRNTIKWKNESIEQGNRELLTFIQNLINERKQRLIQNKEKIEALTKTINIPLKRKISPAAQTVRVEHTPLVQRIKPKPSLPEEYVIDEARVDDIVTMLNNQALTYEQTPKAVKDLGEEDLRDLLLANLNSVFEGNATGETFSKNGKTDIYLKINKGNILISECKIWGGKNLYEVTIDQLRGYLTWRHNYGIMITFVRLKEFTKALRESEGAIQAHPTYINGFKKIGETHFVSNHRVDDEEKSIKIHHLFYNLFSK